jgi:hypothetical protein
LDKLLGTGKISQSTHAIFNKEIDDAIADIEKQQKALLEKMAAKVIEIEGQVKTLEILLANFEIRHVTGEVDEDTYQRENDLLTIGLDAAKQELEEVKDATDQLASGDFTIDEVEPPQLANEEAQPEVKFLDETPPAENETVKVEEESIVETVVCTEATNQDAEEKTEEKQQA